MALAWEEPELLFVADVPVEAHCLVSVVGQLEGHRLRLADDAVANGQLILRKSFKGDALRVAFTSDLDLVLLVWVT